MKVNFEIDMATEGQKAIRDKLQRYWRIYYDADHTAWQGEWPRLVWVAVDEERAKELRWLIAQMPEEARRWQRVRVLETLPDLFGG